MRIAIYARKSKYSEAGDSIENQIDICKLHCEKFKDAEFMEYRDDGWSGASINRPNLQKLIADIEADKIDCIVVYRLDRISRNILDFSKLIDLMNLKDIQFISIKEQFDTSTPMGRAMMYISSVFAQLERETIAERIKDNMYKLAEKGVWLGGVTPYGYKSVKNSYSNSDNKEKAYHSLELQEEEAEFIKLVYKKYLELKSLDGLTKYLKKLGYKSRRGAEINMSSLSLLLRNIIYVKCDQYFCEEMRKKGINISGTPDGEKGILGYGKETKNAVYVIGEHRGIINPKDWLETQKILDRNRKTARLGTGNVGALRGLMTCSVCGSNMSLSLKESVNGTYKSTSGTYNYYYICSTKRRSGKSKCSCNNINGFKADTLIANTLRNYNYNEILSLNKQVDISDNETWLRNNIAKLEMEANRVVELIAITENTLSRKRLLNKLENVDKEIERLNFELSSNNKEVAATDAESLFDDDHEVIKILVDSIVWDSKYKEFHIKFNNKTLEDIVVKM